MTGRLPDEDEVKRRLHDALRSAIPRARTAVAYDEKARANDYFEAFLLATLLKTARSSGWQVSLEDPEGAKHQELRLGASPGSFARPRQLYTHAVLNHRAAFALEAHVGVGVAGASEVEHEADLLLLPQATAEACRDDGVAPHPGQVLLLVEAKFISAQAVPLGYGRGLLGLDKDLCGSMDGALVTTRASLAVDWLLTRWRLHHLGGVLAQPGVVNAEEVTRFFEAFLSKWARSGSEWRAPKRRSR
jgi:hypothetical protein